MYASLLGDIQFHRWFTFGSDSLFQVSHILEIFSFVGGSLLEDIHFYGCFSLGRYSVLYVVHFWELCDFKGGSE
jgi:hypothetical protein